MSGPRTTPVDFDADLLAELRAEEPGKADRELLEDLAIRKIGLATARRVRRRFDLTEDEAMDLGLRALREARTHR
jgi:hypothetical protein